MIRGSNYSIKRNRINFSKGLRAPEAPTVTEKLAFGTNSKVWRRAVPWQTRRRGIIECFPDRFWKVRMNCKAPFSSFPRHRGTNSSSQLQRKALSSLVLWTKKYKGFSIAEHNLINMIQQAVSLPVYSASDLDPSSLRICRSKLHFPKPEQKRLPSPMQKSKRQRAERR